MISTIQFNKLKTKYLMQNVLKNSINVHTSSINTLPTLIKFGSSGSKKYVLQKLAMQLSMFICNLNNTY